MTSRTSPALAPCVRRFVAAVLAVICFGPALVAEQTAFGSGRVDGRVVDAAGGAGVRAVAVTLQRLGSPDTRQAVTDAQGRFSFRAVVPGRYTISANRPGYLAGAYGAGRAVALPVPVVVGEGESLSDLSIRFWRPAVVTGTVTDVSGDPVIGAQVRVWRPAGPATSDRNAAAEAVTDDRGMYRIAGIDPGTYVAGVASLQITLPSDPDNAGPVETIEPDPMGGVSVAGLPSRATVPFQLANGRRWFVANSAAHPEQTDEAVLSYPMVFYPGAPSMASAQPLVLSAAEERSGVDFVLQPVAGRHIAGVVRGAGGEPENAVVRLIAGDRDSGLPLAVSVADTDGRFVFPGITPGRYVLEARIAPTDVINIGSARPPIVLTNANFDGVAWWGQTAVDVASEDVGAAVIVMAPSPNVSGRVTFDSSANDPRPSVAIELLALGTTGSARRLKTDVAERGTFAIGGVPPGAYTVIVHIGTGGWVLRGVQVDGRDAADTPLAIGSDEVDGLVVTVSDRPSELRGAVRADRGRPATDIVVVAFPAEPAFGSSPSSFSRVQIVRVSNAGDYSVTGLPAGAYFVTAVAEGTVTDHPTRADLDALRPLAVRIQLQDRERAVVDLQVRSK